MHLLRIACHTPMSGPNIAQYRIPVLYGTRRTVPGVTWYRVPVLLALYVATSQFGSKEGINIKSLLGDNFFYYF